jgi:hypothetical protein
MVVLPSSVSTIGELQAGIAEALEAIRAGVPLPPGLENLKYLAPPRGFVPKVSFRRVRDQRKIREDASKEYWSPENAFLQIEFVHHAAGGQRADAVPSNEDLEAARKPGPAPFSVGEVQLKDLVLALDRAESDPAFTHFVALKTFRDRYLPQQGYDWSAFPGNRHDVLRHAIEKGLVLKSSVHNPRAPEFPVTAIKLNRNLPEVRAILEGSRRPSPFTPVRVQGHPLSRTVLQDRR